MRKFLESPLTMRGVIVGVLAYYLMDGTFTSIVLLLGACVVLSILTIQKESQ